MSKPIKIDQANVIKLPPLVFGQNDINRILIEIEAVDDDFEAQKIRGKNVELVTPAISRRMAEVLEYNSLDINDQKDRVYLVEQFRNLKQKAPFIHITFAREPEPTIMADLITWVRENLHPSSVVNIGIQPRIIGGCVIRTPDHVYDFSLSGKLRSASHILAERLKEM